MAIDELENLVTIHKLNHEPPDPVEFDGMVLAAATKLQDVQLAGLSVDSQFSLAYGAAHALALAALRWHGYRSDTRYIVFNAYPIHWDCQKQNGGYWISVTSAVI